MTVFQANFNARASLTTYLCEMDWLLASNSQHSLHIFSAEIQKQAMSSHGWMGKLPGSSHLNKAADSMAWMGFKHDFFLENVFRKFLSSALSSIELELNLNSNPCEGLSYHICFAEILSSKIIFSEMNDSFNNLPYFFAAISFSLFLHNHCLLHNWSSAGGSALASCLAKRCFALFSSQ